MFETLNMEPPERVAKPPPSANILPPTLNTEVPSHCTTLVTAGRRRQRVSKVLGVIARAIAQRTRQGHERDERCRHEDGAVARLFVSCARAADRYHTPAAVEHGSRHCDREAT